MRFFLFPDSLQQQKQQQQQQQQQQPQHLTVHQSRNEHHQR
jgi:hypothetical protein